MMYITYIYLIICGRSSSVAGILKFYILYTIVLYMTRARRGRDILGAFDYNFG